MGSETEQELISSPRLPLFWNPQPHGYMQSPQRSGTLTPPIYSSAAVPFRWEEEPGKPRGCTTLANPIESGPKCLERPPRLFLLDSNVSSRLTSPTTVLEGPYMGNKSRLQSSSFRIIRRECHGSLRRSCSPERGQLSTMVLSKRGVRDKGFLGSWRWGSKAFRGKREQVGGASYFFPSSLHIEEVEDKDKEEEEEERSSRNVKFPKIRRSGSFSTHARSHFWATIYEGLKQVFPWSSRKLKKDGFVF